MSVAGTEGRATVGEPLVVEAEATEVPEFSSTAEVDVWVADSSMEETLRRVELVVLLAVCGPWDAEPGWLKPGKPPEVEAGTALVADAGAGSVVTDASDSMGEYVNVGSRWLVSLAVLFSTAATVLDKTAETISVTEGVALLSTVGFSGAGVAEDSGNTLELPTVVGAGVGMI
jgi:hypothetical protein